MVTLRPVPTTEDRAPHPLPTGQTQSGPMPTVGSVATTWSMTPRPQAVAPMTDGSGSRPAEALAPTTDGSGSRPAEAPVPAHATTAAQHGTGEGRSDPLYTPAPRDAMAAAAIANNAAATTAWESAAEDPSLLNALVAAHVPGVLTAEVPPAQGTDAHAMATDHGDVAAPPPAVVAAGTPVAALVQGATPEPAQAPAMPSWIPPEFPAEPGYLGRGRSRADAYFGGFGPGTWKGGLDGLGLQVGGHGKGRGKRWCFQTNGLVPISSPPPMPSPPPPATTPTINVRRLNQVD